MMNIITGSAGVAGVAGAAMIKKLVAGFAGVAVVVLLMLNVAPGVMGEFGGYMIGKMDTMATEVWEGNGGEYAGNMLQEYDQASQQTLNGLENMSNEVIAVAKQEAEAQGVNTTEAEAEFVEFFDDAAEWVLSFIQPGGES